MDCGFRISDCGFGTENLRGSLFNPQSAIRNPQSELPARVGPFKVPCAGYSLNSMHPVQKKSRVDQGDPRGAKGTGPSHTHRNCCTTLSP